MGLKATIATAVATAFQAVGDVKRDVTFVQVVLGAYDPESDTYDETKVETTFEAIAVKPTSVEIEWYPQANRGALKLLVKAADVPSKPTLEDYFLIDTVQWEVVRVNATPDGSLFIVFLQGV